MNNKHVNIWSGQTLIKIWVPFY